MKREFSIPDSVSQELKTQLGDLGQFIKSHPSLPNDILEISKHFQSQERKTEISSDRFQRAYWLYFHTLNVVRASAVLSELKRLAPNFSTHSWLDFGSGLGAIEHAYHSVFAESPCFTFAEESLTTQYLHKKIRSFSKDSAKWVQSLRQTPDRFDTISASYSINELKEIPEALFQADTLILIEPSTQAHTRKLMELRAEIVRKGFSILAPCVHQLECPLLTRTKTDWCYDRVFFERPEWFLELESRLPMKNRTLTFSYLIASRKYKLPDRSNLGRIIGDTLREKGKTKQMMCRGPDREFLSWLDREGAAPELAHGSLVKITGELNKKGAELRCRPEQIEFFN